MDRRSFLLRRPRAAASPPLPAPALPLRRGSLDRYAPTGDAPWDDRRRRHLLRRTGFGATIPEVEALRPLTAQDAVTQVLDAGRAAPLLTPPDWATLDRPDRGTPAYSQYTSDNRRWRRDFESDLIGSYFTPTLRDKLTVFWQNHFVASIVRYDLARHAFDYVQTIRRHALGDFKQFVYDIGLTPAMLFYLDGLGNAVGTPNENYARELMELFTMGLEGPDGTPNYTQDDVRELARALTGWRVDPNTLTSYFEPSRHDDGPKTIFGRTDTFDYASALDWLFEARAESIATFVCTRLYEAFIAAPVNPEHVAALAAQFQADWYLDPIIETLLRSEAFFEDGVIGAQVKDALSFLVSLYRETGTAGLPDSQLGKLSLQLERLEQPYFQPPNVGGWPRGRGWLTTDTLPRRWSIAGQNFPAMTANVQALALTFERPYEADVLAADLAEHLLGVPLTEDEAATLGAILLGGLPPYEWDAADPGVRPRYVALLTHLANLPEFQLT
ncbi:MAG: DUF1800 domain-containing protein [Bacteroidota bacterium]